MCVIVNKPEYEKKKTKNPGDIKLGSTKNCDEIAVVRQYIYNFLETC